MSLNNSNHYDEQFNQRINQIAKPGAATPPSTGKGSSGRGWGFGGAGGAIGMIVFLLFRVLLFSAHSTPSYTTPTYHYTPPPVMVPPHRVNFPDVDRVPDKNADNKNADEELNRILLRIQREQPDVKEKE
jgi:hypothetical protein